MIDSYPWAGGREAMLCFGPAGGPVVIAALPLLEEANRTRWLVAAILRRLAAQGIAAALPELPAMGESTIETEEASLSHWIDGFASATSALRVRHASVHAITFRGGALLDGEAQLDTRWRFAPQAGSAVLRELSRVALASTAETGTRFDPASLTSPGEPVEIAGNRLPRDLLADLARAEPSAATPLRTVRFATDPLPADRHVEGVAPWRRSEPASDPALAALLADDIAGWIAACAG